MNGEPKPKLNSNQIIWVVACVVLITSLFLIGAWLFKPAGEGNGPERKAGPGAVTEQEVNTPGFAPEGVRPGAPAPSPTPGAQAAANGPIPTPPSLARTTPPPASQPAQPSASATVPPPAKDPLPAPSPGPAVVAKGQPAPPAQPAPVPATRPSPMHVELPKAEVSKSAPSKVEQAKSAGAKNEPGDSMTLKGSVWYLQVAAVSDKRRAQDLQKQLKGKGFPSSQVAMEGGLYKVRIPYKDEGGARAARKKLDSSGIKDASGAFVVKPEK